MGENQTETQRFSVGRFLRGVRERVRGEREQRPPTEGEERRRRRATGLTTKEKRQEQIWAAKELVRLVELNFVDQVLNVFPDGTVIVQYEVRGKYGHSGEEAEEEKDRMARLVDSGLVSEYRIGGRVMYFVNPDAREFESLQKALRKVDEKASKRRREAGKELLDWLGENGCSLEKGPISLADLTVRRWIITGPNYAIDALRKRRNQSRYIEGLKREELKELIVETEETGLLILTQAGEVAIGKARRGTFDSYPEEMIPVLRVKKA